MNKESEGVEWAERHTASKWSNKLERRGPEFLLVPANQTKLCFRYTALTSCALERLTTHYPPAT